MRIFRESSDFKVFFFKNVLFIFMFSTSFFSTFFMLTVLIPDKTVMICDIMVLKY